MAEIVFLEGEFVKHFAQFCFLFVIGSTLRRTGLAMQIFVWEDRKNPAVPRAVMQRGRCSENQCGQFAISISNGERGMTVRFESEDEFRQFLERGAVEKR
jgi:hypothetical protein